MGGPGEPRDDGYVLASAAAGEDWALTVLYRRHQPALQQFLYGLAGDDAEDLAAETWIHAARALTSFEGDDRGFRSLLFTIGRRRAVDRLRDRRRRRSEPVDPGALADAPTGTDGQDVADLVADEEAARTAVRRIRALLPHDQAEVVLLRVVAGLSVGEVAEIVGRSRAAVSVLQTRGLQRLARRLGEDVHGGRVAASAEVRGNSGPAEQNLQDPDAGGRWDG